MSGSAPADAALETVELAGQQGLKTEHVGLNLDDLELEALALGETAAARHHDDAGIALGLEETVPPRLRVRRLARCRRGGPEQQRRNRQGNAPDHPPRGDHPHRDHLPQPADRPL